MKFGNYYLLLLTPFITAVAALIYLYVFNVKKQTLLNFGDINLIEKLSSASYEKQN